MNFFKKSFFHCYFSDELKEKKKIPTKQMQKTVAIFVKEQLQSYLLESYRLGS